MITVSNKFLLLACFLTAFSGGVLAQNTRVSISGVLKDKTNKAALSYVNVVLRTQQDSAFFTGTVSDDEGRFTLSNVPPNTYFLQCSFVGYTPKFQPVYVGSASSFLDVGTLEMAEDSKMLEEIVVTGKQDEVSGKMDKKTYNLTDNVSQTGGSVLQALQNLPGVTVQDGKVQLRGSDKITVLIDGKQTALTGFGNQSGLDNIPASAIESIEIINNPSAKYDANGTAGILNIRYKKEKKTGFNGKIGFTTGLGSLWERRANLPNIRPQYQLTPKINPSISLNYRKKNTNLFFQADNLYTQTLNKNEFVTRTYDDGRIIQQQLKRNRNTHFFTTKAGIDWTWNPENTLTVSALFGSEKIIDRGDQPFFNADNSERLRLWQFLEDELKTTVMGMATYQHKFKQPGQVLNIGLNYTFHREDEKYFFDNILPTYRGEDSFKLLSDEQVFDFNLDYLKPLRYGRLETGLKVRKRDIPTNMQFFPGINSPLDTNAGGWATYQEIIPAAYGNYVFETPSWEAELGLRLEYLGLQYDVNPDHNTYKSDGYDYTQPFPNLRVAYKIDEHNKLSLFYNRRVDRPNEVDIRIFPKYDDAEIIKVGNPGLRPQFTQSLELGYKTTWGKGYFYAAGFHRFANGTITRIASTVQNSPLIYAIFQNAGKSSLSGVEMVFTQKISPWYDFSANLTGYYNRIEAFTVQNLYPIPNTFSADAESIFSGNLKLNQTFHLPRSVEAQVSAVYLAPDIIPQGRIAQRFSLDVGVKKAIQNGKGELFLNATDLFNTLVIQKDIQGQEFQYRSTDYYETQVVRLGYAYKF